MIDERLMMAERMMLPRGKEVRNEEVPGARALEALGRDL